MSDILLGGERELQELKKIIQERARYNSVLASMYTTIESQQDAMNTLKENVEKEIRAEEQRRRDEIAKALGAELGFVTVSPDNAFSLKNIMANGFEVLERRRMYGGRDRYILKKNI